MLQSKLNSNSLLMIFFLMAIGFCSITIITSHDIFWHLKSGAWIISKGKVPWNDPFSYTASNAIWIDHTWFFQILTYSIHLISGFSGLILFKSLILILIFFLLIQFLNQQKKSIYIWLILVFLVIQARSAIRPEIFSFLFMVLYLTHLESYQNDPQQYKKLYTLPLLQVFWTNIEGLFMIGPLIILMYLFNSNLNKKHLINSFILSIIALFINPYGWHVILFPFELLGEIISYTFGRAVPVGELASPFSSIVNWNFNHFLFLILLILTFMPMFKHRKNVPTAHWLLFLSFLALTILAQRNMALFALLSPFLIYRYRNQKPVIKYTSPIWIGTLVLMMGLTYSGHLFALNRESKQWGLGISPKIFPHEAINILLKEKDRVRILNDMDFGPMLIYKANPWIKVFIDPRTQIYSQEILNEYRSFYFDPESRKHIIEKYNINICLLSSYHKSSLGLMSQLHQNPDWQLIWTNGYATIFKKENSPIEAHFDFVVPSKNPLYPYMHPFQYQARVLLALEKNIAARQLYLEALSIYPNWFEGCLNIGYLYEKKEEYLKALHYYERSVRLNAASYRAQYNLGKLYLKLGRAQEALVHLHKAVKIQETPEAKQNYFTAKARLAKQSTDNINMSSE